MINSTRFSEEEIRLYNPAYTGYLLYSCLFEFTKKSTKKMHCAIPFLVLPMTMNEQISYSYPSTYITPIATWSASNEGLLIDLPDYVESYIPIVRSAISYLVDRKIITITKEGLEITSNIELVKDPALFKKSNSMKHALQTSKFIGRWFSQVSNVETIFVQLGIRP